MLEVVDLSYNYPDGHEALKGINLTVNDGEKIALVGANGSGKSTLLLNMAGAFDVQSGKIKRGKIGLTFQNADDEILMPTVIEDTAFSLIASGMKLPEANERAMKILADLGISHLSSRSSHKLSGGEKRMVSLAGVLVSNPDTLLLDEPTAGLDPRGRRRVINFLRGTDKTVILATHDLDMALDVCERAVILSEGKITGEGRLPELFTDENLLEANGLELPLRYCAH